MRQVYWCRNNEVVPDHINPRGMGGAWRDDHPDHIQAVHWWCNGTARARNYYSYLPPTKSGDEIHTWKYESREDEWSCLACPEMVLGPDLDIGGNKPSYVAKDTDHRYTTGSAAPGEIVGVKCPE